MSAGTTTRAPLLTIPEVARRLGLHRDTVYLLRDAVEYERGLPDAFDARSLEGEAQSSKNT
jgi:hypothetical protein